MESWHVTTALGVLAAGSLVLMGWIVAARPQGSWTALAASIQALATVLLILVTTLFVRETSDQSEAARRSAAAVEESVEAMRRTAEASERALSLRVHEQRVKRLSSLQRLVDRAHRHRSRAERRTTDPSLPDGPVFPEEGLRELERWTLSVDEKTASSTVEAVDAAGRVRDLAADLEDALGTEDERMARQDFAAANRRTADAFENVERNARAEIDRLKSELGVASRAAD